VGVDVEEPKGKILTIANKFITEQEKNIFGMNDSSTTVRNFQRLRLSGQQRNLCLNGMVKGCRFQTAYSISIM
jgi:hypothetical protein